VARRSSPKKKDGEERKMSEWDNSNCPLCKRLGVLNSMNKTLKNIRDSLPKRGLLKWM